MKEKITIHCEIGHWAKRISSKNNTDKSNFTHAWKVWVCGRYGPLEAFVSKVVFRLHPTFPNPVQEVVSPPFEIEERGFGTFPMQIDLHFQDQKASFEYELMLMVDKDINCKTMKTFSITNPKPADFRRKLIDAGGVVSPADSQPKEKKPSKISRQKSISKAPDSSPTKALPSSDSSSNSIKNSINPVKEIPHVKSPTKDLNTDAAMLPIKSEPMDSNELLIAECKAGIKPDKLVLKITKTPTKVTAVKEEESKVLEDDNTCNSRSSDEDRDTSKKKKKKHKHKKEKEKKKKKKRARTDSHGLSSSTDDRTTVPAPVQEAPPRENKVESLPLKKRKYDKSFDDSLDYHDIHSNILPDLIDVSHSMRTEPLRFDDVPMPSLFAADTTAPPDVSSKVRSRTSSKDVEDAPGSAVIQRRNSERKSSAIATSKLGLSTEKRAPRVVNEASDYLNASLSSAFSDIDDNGVQDSIDKILHDLKKQEKQPEAKASEEVSNKNTERAPGKKIVIRRNSGRIDEPKQEVVKSSDVQTLNSSKSPVKSVATTKTSDAISSDVSKKTSKTGAKTVEDASTKNSTSYVDDTKQSRVATVAGSKKTSNSVADAKKPDSVPTIDSKILSVVTESKTTTISDSKASVGKSESASLISPVAAKSGEKRKSDKSTGKTSSKEKKKHKTNAAEERKKSNISDLSEASNSSKSKTKSPEKPVKAKPVAKFALDPATDLDFHDSVFDSYKSSPATPLFCLSKPESVASSRTETDIAMEKLFGSRNPEQPPTLEAEPPTLSPYLGQKDTPFSSDLISQVSVESTGFKPSMKSSRSSMLSFTNSPTVETSPLESNAKYQWNTKTCDLSKAEYDQRFQLCLLANSVCGNPKKEEEFYKIFAKCTSAYVTQDNGYATFDLAKIDPESLNKLSNLLLPEQGLLKS